MTAGARKKRSGANLAKLEFMTEAADISLSMADLVKIRRRGYHAPVFGGDSPRSIRGSRDAGQEQQHRAVIARGY